MTATTALEVSQPRTLGLVRPVAGPAAVIEAHAEAAALIKDALEQGTDYGVIPGTSKQMVLLKPGAERLTLAFGASVHMDIIEQEIDHDREVTWTKWSKSGSSRGLYRYVVRVRLVRADGTQIGEGIGSASTMEAKYVDRPRDCENTVLKMAKKRAHVDAVLSMAALSGRFTQDIDDAVDDRQGGGRDDRDNGKDNRDDEAARAQAKKAAEEVAAARTANAAIGAAVVALAEQMLDEAVDVTMLRDLRAKIVDVVAGNEKMKTALVALSEQVSARIADDTWVPVDASQQQAVIWLRAQVAKAQETRKATTTDTTTTNTQAA